MTRTESKAAWRRYRHVCVGAALAVLLGGCGTMETVGEALNPVNWFDDDEQQTAAEPGEDAAAPQAQDRYKALQGEDKASYPKLSAVPARPKVPTSAQARAARASLHDGLVSDAANARYSDQELRARDLPILGKAPAAMAVKPDMARSNDRVTGAANGAGAGEALRLAGGDPSELPPRREARPTPPRPADVNEARNTDPAAATQTIQVATIYFADGSARLSRDDREIVRQVAAIVQSRRGRVRIIGHSSMGTPGGNESARQRANYSVSLKRAQAIAAALRQYGLSPDDMAVSAEGARKPIYQETAPSGAASNRRAEIFMEYQKRS